MAAAAWWPALSRAAAAAGAARTCTGKGGGCGRRAIGRRIGGDGVEVDVRRPDLGVLAHVTIDGADVPFDATNGWHMLSGTTVQLEGAACERWRVPGETSIAFDFPCDVIVIR